MTDFKTRPTIKDFIDAKIKGDYREYYNKVEDFFEDTRQKLEEQRDSLTEFAKMLNSQEPQYSYVYGKIDIIKELLESLKP